MFSKRLSELRKSKGMTQVDLSKQIHVATGTIGIGKIYLMFQFRENPFYVFGVVAFSYMFFHV